MAEVLSMVCILFTSLIIRGFFSFFLLPSEIRTDRESENMMNFLYLLTAVKLNASSIAQASAFKMDASLSKHIFFY